MDRRSFLTRSAASGATAAVLAQLAQTRAAFAATAAGVSAPGELGARDEYGLAPGVVYFNHAAIGATPSAVREARERRLRLCETNPWLYVWGGAWEDDDAQARAAAAEFLGCGVNELAVIHNTTEGFNLLASGLDLNRGDEVLFSSLNHVGASECWRRWGARRGYSVRRFEMPVQDVPSLTERDVVALHVEQIRDETRVLVLPHIDNMVGLRHPVRAIADAARAKGVEFVFVDAAQSVGMIDVAVRDLGCDAMATSAHKWLQTPKGLGLLCVAPALRERLEPMWVTWGQARWKGTTRVYEDYGTRDPTLTLALGDAVAFHTRTPWPLRARHARSLRERLQERVRAAPRLRWRSPGSWEMGSALVGVEVAGARSADVFEALRPRGFIFRPFDQGDYAAMRISVNLVNTSDEIDRFFEALAQAGFAGG